MATRRTVLWWNVQRLLRPNGRALSRALNATAAEGWTRARFEEKVDRCAATLRQLVAGQRPALVAMAEVADDNLAALVAKRSGLGLQVVRETRSPLAGADLVLLIDPDLFAVIGDPVSYNVTNRFTTRDIYQARLITPTGADLVVVICHWPSRRLSNSEPLRIAAADWTRRLVEETLKYPITDIVSSTGQRRLPPPADLATRARTALLLMGDFNDTPYDISINEVIGAVRDTPRARAALRVPKTRTGSAVTTYLSQRIPLVNPCWPLLITPPTGSTYWNGQWYLLDQMLYSPGMLPPTTTTPTEPTITFVPGSPRIAAPRTIDVNGTNIEWCSPSGVPTPYDPRTRDGISDHLPLLAEIDIP